ncbi:MAG: DUF732 domain-containing protein [Lyngbya sp. HA4199-MV5]|nr:DUF732 domain-containing protein [Lyngbya sp. HA4199-MV5]
MKPSFYWLLLPAALVSLTLSSCSGQTTKAPVTSPSPVAVESPSPQTDTFDAGLAKASDASYTAKTAETSEDWDLAVSRWHQAIELMQGVPTGTANFAQAQEKLAEYKRGLLAAQKRITPKEVASAPVVSEPESTPIASKVDTSSWSEDQKEQVFLAAVDGTASPAEKAWGATVSNAKKVEIAKGACKEFDRGATFNDIGLEIIKAFGSKSAAGRYTAAMVGGGVSVYCPEHRSKIPSSH